MAVGQNDHQALVRASWSALVVATGCALIGSVVYALFPEWCANLFLDPSKPDAVRVLAFAAQLVVIAGLFQLVDGLQVIATGLLRGIKDTRVPMFIAFISYWGIGFVLAYVLAFRAGMGGIGVWIGFLCGLGAAAVLLLWRYVLIVGRMR
jgi:MATE family multidrug resistance protein